MSYDTEDLCCPMCGEMEMGSHYHCPNCGETCSMMGHTKFVNGKVVDGYSCEHNPEKAKRFREVFCADEESAAEAK